jgi:hypothetical protein
MSTQVPEHGGRILLLRDAVDERGASYRVELAASGSVFTGALRVEDADGAVTLGAFEPDPPAWLLTQVAPLARTLWSSRRKDPDLVWPRRLHRWRGEK